MEATAYFERKVGLSPQDLKQLSERTVKGKKYEKKTIDEILLEKLDTEMKEKCSEHGFVLPGTLKILSRSMGYFEHARFTGESVYFVKLEGRVLYPADGIRVRGEVNRKNKLGLYVIYRDALRIQIPRDLHIGNEEFDSVRATEPGRKGDLIEVELKKSRFQINDPFILANGIFIRKVDDGDATVVLPPTEAPMVPPVKAKTQTEEDEEEEEELEEEDGEEEEEEEADEEEEDEEEETEEGDEGEEEGAEEVTA